VGRGLPLEMPKIGSCLVHPEQLGNNVEYDDGQNKRGRLRIIHVLAAIG
jgi:hypothetical protein